MNREQHVDEMVRRLEGRLLGDLRETVAWFVSQMPKFYFHSTEPDEQERHLEMLHAFRHAHESRLTMVDDGQAGKLLVFGRPADHTLLDVVRTVGERQFHRLEMHTSKDRRMFLYAFCYGSSKVPQGVDIKSHRDAIQQALCGADNSCSVQAIRYLDAVDQGYLARSTVERVVRHIRSWSNLRSADDLHLAVDEDIEGKQSTRFLAATSGINTWHLLLHIARIIHRHGIELQRGYLDLVPSVEGNGHALVSTIYVTTSAGKTLSKRAAEMVASDLRALRRQYRDSLADLFAEKIYTLDELAVLRAAITFSGQMLVAEHRYLEVDENGEEVVRTYPDICRALVGLLAARFEPGATISRKAWDKRRKELAEQIHLIDVQAHHAVLECMLTFISAVRLTNLFRVNHFGLSFKIDRDALPSDRFPHKPYGLFYFSGPHARGFHVRFRASARGGLRILMPRTAGQYQLARDGLLKEVYDLAWAQQLKNKDIPEGGSKCIALVEPGGDATAAVKQLVDSLIDLILTTGAVPEVIGPHDEPRENDLIFLGPDENMTPERINWVSKRAEVRGLPHSATLMSSKPGSGINHKEFGVTSEGIFRWVLIVLPLIGINATETYSVKMTGGPDGDVAGNMLKIMHREHGTRVKVVAISDGTGALHDADGLDWGELLRLVHEGLGVAKFNPSKIKSSTGRVVPAVDKTSEQFRNNLHNSVTADLFLPCGGRPYTINDKNWQAFLLPDGKPSAKAMVEGANIFLTPEARSNLEKAGLIAIKDSSANKGGVICSSYEVLAGLVMSEAEFIERKARYVKETIAIIHSRADDEARAMVSAWIRRGRSESLSALSPKLSEEINRVSGMLETVIQAHLEDAGYQATWLRHLRAHCPHVMVESFAERLLERIPRPHRIAILAKRLASRMVYKEGMTWCQNYLREDRLWDVLSTYLRAEAQVANFTAALSKMEVPDRDILLRVINAGGQRELVRERLGQIV
jgi:glutamate dehydrogenase